MNKVKSILEGATKMLSSHNLYKSTETIDENQSRKIETSYSIKKKKTLVFDEAMLQKQEEDYVLNEHQKHEMKKFRAEIDENKIHLKKIFKKERDKFFNELSELKKKVLAQAAAEAEVIKKDAYQVGLLEGQEDGYLSGLENGYEAGKKEANELKENANKVILQATKEMEIYQKEKQKEFIELASIMAEIIINRELSLSQKDLKYLLDPVLNKLDSSDNFLTIFVTKANLESTNTYMSQLRESHSDIKYAVLVDESLEKNGCIIETNYELIDLQLRKQLDNMVKDLLKGNAYD